MGSAKNRLILGDLASPIITLEGDCIRSVTGILSSDILAQELANDTIEAVLDSVGWFTELSPADEDEPLTTQDGDPLTLADNAAAVYMGLPVDTPVWWYHGDRCLGQFYLQEIRRTGKTQFTLKAQSIVGLLDSYPFYGTVLDGYNLRATIYRILETDGMSYNTSGHRDASPAISAAANNLTFDGAIWNTKVYGAIPVCTKREALQHVLFAYSLTLRRTASGGLKIAPILAQDPQKIPGGRIFKDGTVTVPDRAQRVELTEHSYWAPKSASSFPTSGVEENGWIKLVGADDNSDAIPGERLITFKSAPIKFFWWSADSDPGLTWRSPYAGIVTKNGTLWGYPYTHAKTVLSTGAETDGTVASVTDAYMVTSDTSDALLNLLYRYYSARTETEMSVVLADETLLGNYAYENPYREPETGYLTGMTVTASEILKCDAKLIAGFSPDADVAQLAHYVILTGVGEWETPAEVLAEKHPRLQVVIIGGGDGGFPGEKGANGKKWRGASSAAIPSNPAGNRGTPGASGRVLRVVLRGDSVKPKFSYSCGVGGVGGSLAVAPTAGTDSVFGDYTSADGVSNSAGISNLMTGDVYAKSGDDDAHGGNSGNILGNNDTGYWFSDGGGVQDLQISINTLNDGGKMVKKFIKLTFRNAYTSATYGCPGGAGFGEDGKDSGKPSINSSSGAVRTGNGGNGGNSTLKPPRWIDYLPTAYGYGGRGGYGGGAGGDAGWAHANWSPGVTSGTPGKGGAGGPGGDGSPGCIIIYY